MLFNSLNYFIFLTIVLVIYWFLSLRQQNKFLLCASFIFYAYWDIRFLFLITLTSVIDYSAALFIDRGKLSPRERLLSSAWLIATCFLFIVIPYHKAALDDLIHGNIYKFLFSNILGWKIFISFTTITILGNLFYTSLTKISEIKRRRILLASTIIVKLGILGFFKYFNFFIDTLSGLITSIGLDPERFHLDIILPVAISFYIFHTMSYTIDVFKSKMVPTTKFVDFALFVAYFPLLAAGPIVRASSLIPILSNKRTFQSEQIWRGLHLILLGLFKKVAIADGIAATATQVFQSSGYLSWSDTILGPLCFCIQIYCDFSGYSDIARGTSKLFGIDIMLNFNLPYFSRSPSEFWTRWHISLSSWLRDYLYISLGGNRNGQIRTYFNLMITMFLGGLWHGAAWNFALWGIYQGFILCIYRIFENIRGISEQKDNLLIGFSKWFLFFIITCYGWLLFRSPSMNVIVKLTTNLFTHFGDFAIHVVKPSPAALLGIPILMLYEFYAFKFGEDKFYRRLPIPLQGLLYASIIFVFILGLKNAPSQFIYFNF